MDEERETQKIARWCRVYRDFTTSIIIRILYLGYIEADAPIVKASFHCPLRVHTLD